MNELPPSKALKLDRYEASNYQIEMNEEESELAEAELGWLFLQNFSSLDPITV